MERTIANMKSFTDENGSKSLGEMDIKGLNDMLIANNVKGRYDQDKMDLVTKAFDLYFEGGEKGLIGAFSPEEFKYINSIIAPQGGFTVPVESSMQVTPKAFDGRGIFELIGKVPAKSGSYTDVIDLSDYDKAIYGNDLTAVVEDVNEEGEVELEFIVKEQIYTKKHSRTFMEDSWNPISYYVEQMIEGMGRDTASAIVTGKTVNGTNVNGIQGILEAEEGVSPVRKINFIESENAAADLAFTWTDAVKMIRALPDKYHANANFAMRRQTFFDLLIEKDDNGTYQTNKMLNFFTGQGSALSILNYPVVWDAGLQDTATAGNKPVLLGDFQAGYTYLERLGVSIIRDDVTNARRIIFHVRRRNGGGLRLSEAIVGLKMK
jgi:HK97 family phage major capsid protein